MFGPKSTLAAWAFAVLAAAGLSCDKHKHNTVNEPPFGLSVAPKVLNVNTPTQMLITAYDDFGIAQKYIDTDLTVDSDNNSNASDDPDVYDGQNWSSDIVEKRPVKVSAVDTDGERTSIDDFLWVKHPGLVEIGETKEGLSNYDADNVVASMDPVIWTNVVQKLSTATKAKVDFLEAYELIKQAQLVDNGSSKGLIYVIRNENGFDDDDADSVPEYAGFLPLTDEEFAEMGGTLDARLAVETRVADNNIYLTKWGDNSSFTGESDYLLQTDAYRNTLADILATGTGATGNPAPNAPTWLTLFDNWTNGVVAGSPDDEISNTVANGWGMGIDRYNNVVTFYLETATGEKVSRVYLTTQKMTEFVESVKSGLADVYTINGKDWKAQTEFDPNG